MINIINNISMIYEYSALNLEKQAVNLKVFIVLQSKKDLT